jgi:hypothetical protein
MFSVAVGTRHNERREKHMQVLCKSTVDSPDLCCPVCGHGFALLWERQSRAERSIALRQIAAALRGHHDKLSSPDAHPQRGFIVPDRNGPTTFSGAATLGHAPSWAL